MGKGLIALLLIGLFVVVIGMWGVGKYNGFVTANEQVSAQWSQVENVYQRRMDLIPNLVETVKGVANFEQKTYTDVAEARARAGQITISKELLNNPESFAQFEKAQGELSGALSRLLATVENYPQLKANQNFLDLQTQLEGTENRITVERQRFNEVARVYNTLVKRFPARLIAGLTGFEPRPYFQAREGAAEPPKVKF